MHETDFTQGFGGKWVPAIPEPYFLGFGRVRCECGEKFKNKKHYRGHYALVHILGLTDD